VEMDHEPDRYEVVAVVVEERAAAGRISERPAEGVLHETGLVLLRRDLPQLLEADAELLRLAAPLEPGAAAPLLCRAAPPAFGKQRVLGAQLHAARERVLGLAFLSHAHVAGRDADDLAVRSVENLGRGEARIDLDADRFRLAAEPARDLAERDDEVAVVA